MTSTYGFLPSNQHKSPYVSLWSTYLLPAQPLLHHPRKEGQIRLLTHHLIIQGLPVRDCAGCHARHRRRFHPALQSVRPDLRCRRQPRIRHVRGKGRVCLPSSPCPLMVVPTLVVYVTLTLRASAGGSSPWRSKPLYPSSSSSGSFSYASVPPLFSMCSIYQQVSTNSSHLQRTRRGG